MRLARLRSQKSVGRSRRSDGLGSPHERQGHPQRGTTNRLATVDALQASVYRASPEKQGGRVPEGRGRAVSWSSSIYWTELCSGWTQCAGGTLRLDCYWTEAGGFGD